MANIIEANASTFDSLLGNELPVVIDFWAPWCGPCRMLSPVVDEIAGELEGKIVVAKCNVDENQDLAMRYGVMSIPTVVMLKVVVAKCNVDENQDLAMRYGVMSIPTVVMLKGGAEVMRSVGAVPKPKLKGDIEANI